MRGHTLLGGNKMRVEEAWSEGGNKVRVRKGHSLRAGMVYGGGALREP